MASAHAPRLTEMIDLRHALAKLEKLIDWEFFETEWASFFPATTGRPAPSPRLVAGLLSLQHAYRLSDDAVVARWVENPYDQHFTGETFFQHRLPVDPSCLTRWRLPEALEQVAILTGRPPDLAVVDRGYRGHGVSTTKVLISGKRRGLTPKLKTLLRRRSAIEPEIGHMKTDGRLSRCPLKGTFGDAVFAVLCGCGHNIRKILARLRALLSLILAALCAAATDRIRPANC
ncbi:transposase [Loktanella sp. M215]|uniref:transposase n=1 Tax=Loktanella sp. M215 TaxID=2675431 RepID=UPI001F29D0EA|nr:transposase [Loktanella sp. M215]MCF7701865.1 hypothetical protein [Loktanella sp. M215]